MKIPLIKFFVLMHANAESRLLLDQERRLTKLGRQQAEKRKELFGEIEFDAVFHSSAFRSKETALIVSGLGRYDPKVFEIKELYRTGYPVIDDEMSAALKALGNASLEGYYWENKDTAIKEASKMAVLKIFNKMEYVMENSGKKDKLNVLIVGHEVSVMALGAFLDDLAESSKFLAETVAEECQGYILEPSIDDKEPKITAIIDE